MPIPPLSARAPPIAATPSPRLVLEEAPPPPCALTVDERSLHPSLPLSSPCNFRRWKRGEPKKLFLIVCRRDFHGVEDDDEDEDDDDWTEGEPGGVAEGLWVGVVLPDARGSLGLDKGEEQGLPPLLRLAFLKISRGGETVQLID